MKLPSHVVWKSLSLVGLAVLARGEVIERVIVRVNSDIVTQSEFEARQVAEIQARRIPPADMERFLRENNARILQDAVDELLLVQRAAELGYARVPPQYLNELIDGIKKENGIESEEELAEQLRREGMTLADLKRNIERRILTEQVLRRELEPRLNVTEAEARAEYAARKDDFSRLASVSLQEVVIPDSDDALALAREVAHRARNGEDFAELARRFSHGPTRDTGGELGRVNRGDLTPEVEAVAFTLPVGGVSDPIRTGNALRILKVTDRSEASVVPFEAARGDVVRRLAQSRAAVARDEYLDELRQKAIIDLRVREVPLQVTVPEGASLLEAPSLGAAVAEPPGAGVPATRPGADAEFVTSPQSRPERVAPPPADAPPAPTPTPSP